MIRHPSSGDRIVRTATLLLAFMTAVAPTTALTAEDVFPVANGFGFDWLQPERATCARISSTDAKRFGRCDFHASGAFGLPLAYHACKVKGGSEFLVFKTATACDEALETMQANAP